MEEAEFQKVFDIIYWEFIKILILLIILKIDIMSFQLTIELPPVQQLKKNSKMKK